MSLYNDNLERAMEIGDQEGIAGTLNNIALIHNKKGEYEHAMELYNESLEISRQIEDISNWLEEIWMP